MSTAVSPRPSDPVGWVGARWWRRPLVVLLAVALAWAGMMVLPDRAAFAGTSSGRSAPDGRSYDLFVPTSYAGDPAALVVMLHGCTQNPTQFAAGTQMNAVAEAEGFLVAYPLQPSSAHPNSCWRWFDWAHQTRGRGEPASLAGVVTDIAQDYAVAADRVYVAGLSAGAAMAVVMGATYPDVFSAIGVGSGLEYKAAESESQGSIALFSGGPDPDRQGALAHQAMGSRARVVPTIVFHGTSDYVVYPLNGDQVVSQWAQTNDLALDGTDDDDIDDVADRRESGQVPGGRSYTRDSYTDDTGTEVLAYYRVTAMGHAWSGGSYQGSYTDPEGPPASELMWQFFTQTSGVPAPDPTPTATPTPTPTATPTPTPGTQQAVFSSIGSEDGTAGALWADGVSTSAHRSGDKGMYNTDTYRTVLSFNTASLPDDAIIESATLEVTRQSIRGSVQAITVDIRRGSFGGNRTLAQTDYGAAATAMGVATFAPPAQDGQTATTSLSRSGVAAINPVGRTQLRLRATTPVNFAADQFHVRGGESLTAAPRLTVEYRTP